MRNKRVSPQYNRSQQWSHAETVNYGEEDTTNNREIWYPEIEKNEHVCEVTEVEHEVVIFRLFVDVPPVGYEDEGFLCVCVCACACVCV